MSRYLILAARLVAILTIAVPVVFALDVINSGASVPDMMVGLMIQLTPSVILLALLTLAWQQPVPGGIVFVVVSGVPLFFLPIPMPMNVMLAAPLLLAGILFIAGGVKQG